MVDKVKAAGQKMIENLLPKTGKTLEQWYHVIEAKGVNEGSKHGDIMKLLKQEFELSHGYANLVVMKFREKFALNNVDPVAAQYQGDKQVLRPIYDKLIECIAGFGQDVEVSPKKSYVSLRRAKQFAIIQPSTKTRVDVGINLSQASATDRLEKSGSFNAMVSHRVRLASVSEIDNELTGWLYQAYENAGK
jgi:predicted transport protein